MRDLGYIQQFSICSSFGLTSPLTHSEVKILATSWLPQIRFHEKDLYHPIGLVQYLQQASTYTDSDSDFWIKLYRKFTDAQSNLLFVEVGEAQPPVAFLSHHKDSTTIALDANDISAESYITCLKDLSYDRSKNIYGSTSCQNNYQMPRLPLIIIAEFRMLRDALKHNILAHRDLLFPKTNDGKLLDAVRGDFLFGSNNDEWDLLLKLIDYSEKGDLRQERAILAELEEDHLIMQEQWHVVRDFGFLQYYFIYAYNDTEYYPELSRIDSNEHESDIEGCCVAFRRVDIEGIRRCSNQSQRNDYLKSSIKPYCMMTSAHEARNKLDGIRLFDRTHSADDIRRQDLVVWVALASHATYLDGTQDHNINAITDAAQDILDNASAIAACLILGPLSCAFVTIFVEIFDHFNDATDITSNNGVYTGAPGQTAPQSSQQDPQFIAPIIETTPLSTECNIYIGHVENGDANHTLAQRSFPGKWGGHNGCVDVSPTFCNKTARFYELLLNKGDV